MRVCVCVGGGGVLRPFVCSARVAVCDVTHYLCVCMHACSNALRVESAPDLQMPEFALWTITAGKKTDFSFYHKLRALRNVRIREKGWSVATKPAITLIRDFRH